MQAFVAEAKNAEWQKPIDIKDRYGSADFLAGNRVIFNIKGNDCRFLGVNNGIASMLSGFLT